MVYLLEKLYFVVTLNGLITSLCLTWNINKVFFNMVS